MFNMPHRDVQASKTDFILNSGQLIDEYLADPVSANGKYLDESGESKIFEISGQVASITEDFNQQKVVLIKSPEDKAGISCTFTHETNASVKSIREGQHIVVKGVIRSGASYDDDLQMYENVIMEKCDIVSKM
jgi:RecG-like helicase